MIDDRLRACEAWYKATELPALENAQLSDSPHCADQGRLLCAVRTPQYARIERPAKSFVRSRERSKIGM